MTGVTAREVRVFSLPEFDTREFKRDELSEEEGNALWQAWGRDVRRVDVEFPSPRTGGVWRITNPGHVGVLPVGRDLVLSLEPKVPLRNLFEMLAWAYELEPFAKTDDLVGVASMSDVFESLARTLARRVRGRVRKGLHRVYVDRRDRPSAIRGRIDLRRVYRLRTDPRLDCIFGEQTADHEDNQILLFTLGRILRAGLCRGEIRYEVADAFRELRHSVGNREFDSSALKGRSYSRLNADYRGHHALARFFLENIGAAHGVGDSPLLPFQVGMAGLFETFVAKWLGARLPEGLTVSDQVGGHYDPGSRVGYQIDLVLKGRDGLPLMVLDTKYKAHQTPIAQDVAQVVAYASALGCRRAALIYPWNLARMKPFHVGEVRVEVVPFPLDGDLEEGGRELTLSVGGSEEGSVNAAGVPRGDWPR